MSEELVQLVDKGYEAWNSGVVVGSQSNASVRTRFRGKGMKLDYEPTESDLKLLLKGTKLAARIHFASGALRVMPMTFRSLSFTSPEQVDELDEIVRDNTDIGLHTSHPQGGNALSRDRSKGASTSDSRSTGRRTSTSATRASSRHRSPSTPSSP